jgi:pimeloyl-ACP methyl ester carboxylesterase
VPEARLFPFNVGAHHNALLMVLEHRYYGESQLFDNWETENFKYLSSEQALSDLASFIQHMTSEKSRKVIVVGGSYPGALSAWFRERYPHLAVASWSSSGVVQPIIDFQQFDNQIYTSTVKSGEFCPEYIQSITKYVTNSF